MLNVGIMTSHIRLELLLTVMFVNKMEAGENNKSIEELGLNLVWQLAGMGDL
jgi:hypothetical protein